MSIDYLVVAAAAGVGLLALVVFAVVAGKAGKRRGPVGAVAQVSALLVGEAILRVGREAPDEI